MTTVILIPIKDPAQAKSRMAPLLTEEERRIVAWAMFEDLVDALAPLPYPVVLVTSSPRASRRAALLKWRVIPEREQTSESASVDAASRLLADEGVEAVLRLPADIPLIQSADIAELLTRPICPPAAVLVPSHDRRGTNALLRTPPDLFPSRFGPDSYALHCREAARVGARLKIERNPRLALDLDDAADIARFMAARPEGHTYRVLTSLAIEERLGRHGM